MNPRPSAFRDHLALSLALFLAPALLADVLAPLAPPEGTKSAPIEEYCKKIAAVSPRDPQGLFELSRWCEDSGLKKEARKLLERVIEVDPEHAAARTALGYRRYGLGWKIGGERPAPVPAEEAADAKDSAKGKPATPSGPTSPPAPEPPVEKPEKGDEPGKPGSPEAKSGPPKAEGEAKAEVVKAADVIARKKAWAKESAQKLMQTLNLSEEEDFLVHTSFEAGSAQVRNLVNLLKAIKKNILTLTGARTSPPIWPEKVHLLYFRAAAECVTFAEVVDGIRFPEQQGWYTHDEPQEHTVFYRLEGDILAQVLGETALDRMNGSSRWVNWWLRQGVASWVAAQTEEGKQRQRYPKAFQQVAAELASNSNAFNIADLLESPGMSKRETIASQARVLTLVDFLYQTNKRGFQKLIEDLKSEQAPAPPADNANFKEFFVQYIAFQEEALNKIYRQKLEKLDGSWKNYVLKQNEAMEKSGQTKKGPGAGAGSTGGGNKGGGATGAGGGNTGGGAGGKSGGGRGPERPKR